MARRGVEAGVHGQRDPSGAAFARPPIAYLDEGELVRLLASVGNATVAARRDRALLLLLYNTGARVHELVGLDIGHVQDDAIPIVRLLGKGRKQRSCPLWQRTVGALRHMLADRATAAPSQPLFLNARGHRLSRSGVTHLLRRAARAGALAPRHAGRLSPHVIRHTTAMHLLRSGVDITTIAAWLGHATLDTTHGYVEVDLRMKQAAIAAASALPIVPDPPVWLAALVMCSSRHPTPPHAAPPGPTPHNQAPRITLLMRSSA